ncbi:MAG: pilus assembly protein CpaD [Rhizobiales bacterium]|nr:pilus assembly protein CpaD [Hyphomicrobiales bacterium]
MTRDYDATAGRPGSRSILVRAALLAGCAALLAGCNTHSGKDITAAVPADYRQRHPIVIKEKDRTVELFIGNSRGGLTPDQRADVPAFAQAWKREATGGIVINVPVGAHNAAAAGGAVRKVRSILTASGIPAKGIVVRGYRIAGPAQLATVRLNYPRMAAEAGPCGLWPADVGPTARAYLQNKPYWNHGCASQRNLAAMVANPADLVQPRGDGAAYQMRRTYVLEQYRTGAATWSAPSPGAEAAKIGEVGK